MSEWGISMSNKLSLVSPAELVSYYHYEEGDPRGEGYYCPECHYRMSWSGEGYAFVEIEIAR